MESEVIEEIKRHFDVVAESLRGDIKTIAEGHIILNRKIDEFRDGNEKDHQEMRKEMWHAVKGLSRENEKAHQQMREENEKAHQEIHQEISDLREENEKAHQEILSAIKFSYAELDRRLIILEDKYVNLNTRLKKLEISR